jgi:hypothetical protein
LASGCSSATLFTRYPQKIAPYLATIESGKPVAARKILRSESDGTDRILYRMERGRFAQLAGDTAQSRDDFAAAIGAIRKNDERALISASAAGSELGSWLLNDNARPYEGEGYERVMLYHFQALNYLLDGDLDLEPEHHDGEASFPSSPLYAITDPLAIDGGPGDREDAEVDDPPEEDDLEDCSLDRSLIVH